MVVGLMRTPSRTGALVTAPYMLAPMTRYSPSSDNCRLVTMSEAATPTVRPLTCHWYWTGSWPNFSAVNTAFDPSLTDWIAGEAVTISGTSVMRTGALVYV